MKRNIIHNGLKILIVTLLLSIFSGQLYAYDRRTPIVEAVEKVLPAVVDISTTKSIKVSPFPSFFSTPFDDQLERFYKRFERTYQLEGLGSGVVVEGGYVITNDHVVKYEYGYADKIVITFYENNIQKEATIIGVDSRADVAILAIEGEAPVSHLPWGRSDDLMIGETVIAIGNALGQSFTVTNGIISALNRSISDESGRELHTLIQTNADINRGNSGGPLVNINGEFIGLNTAILSPSGGSVGLGFAIPISRVKQVYDYWVNHIPALEDRMGIEYQDMTPDLRLFFQSNYEELKDKPLSGIVVLNVEEDGFCADALLRRDIIVGVDGKTVINSREFVNHLEEHRGKTLQLSLIREGQKETLQIKVPNERIQTTQWLGMEMQELDSPWRRWYGIDKRQHGLVVLSVFPKSRAAEAGIKRGDIVLAINAKPVVTLEDLKAARKELKNQDDVILDIYKRSENEARRIQLPLDSIL